MFTDKIEINDYYFEVCFRIVPDHTMSYDCILGRDFMNHSNLILSFHKRIVNVAMETIQAEPIGQKELLLINCHSASDKSYDLKIVKLPYDILVKIEKLVYKENVGAPAPLTDFEIPILLNDNKPFYVCPRKMSVLKKKIVDDTVDDQLIQK